MTTARALAYLARAGSDESEYVDGMLKRVLAVVLLGFLGLITGYAFGVLFPQFDVEYAIKLPAHSPHSASDLVRMTRDEHPGARVVAFRGGIDFSATGNLGSADRAVNMAARKVILANDGKVKRSLISNPGQEIPASYLVRGLLAGLGTALGFLVPPRGAGRDRHPPASKASGTVSAP